MATFYIASCYNRYHRWNISAYTDLGYLLNLNMKIHPLLSSHFPFVWYRYHPFFFLTTWGRNAMEFLKLEFDDRSFEKYFLRLISIYFQAFLSPCKYGLVLHFSWKLVSDTGLATVSHSHETSKSQGRTFHVLCLKPGIPGSKCRGFISPAPLSNSEKQSCYKLGWNLEHRRKISVTLNHCYYISRSLTSWTDTVDNTTIHMGKMDKLKDRN